MTDDDTRLHVLEATASDGWILHTGPVDIGEAIILIDRHLTPNGWTPQLLPLTPIDKAIKHFTGAKNPQPVEEADLFVNLRRAIITDQANDGADCPRAATLIAHLEAHRPRHRRAGVEECLLGECDHDTQDGRCPGVEPAESVCAACTAIYDTGSEYGPELMTACRIEWPCAIIEAVAGYYRVPLDGMVAS